jgi:hypothetical protein
MLPSVFPAAAIRAPRFRSSLRKLPPFDSIQPTIPLVRPEVCL